ncbi:MAG: TIGR00282 family metallophosphoesterase [Candidatus Gracilibacteria bacterium]|nr:TIGR00282 family metallophosphoesterase [Candidatus Gracilibacteria bacterium]
MKILFLGDIVARAGRDTVKKVLPNVIKEHSPDFIIGNVENLSHGNGFTPRALEEMEEAGIDFFTSGDHAWGGKAGSESIASEDFPVIRPANVPPEVPGIGYFVAKSKQGHKILVINLVGRVFMKKNYDCPFRTVDKILKKFAKEKLDAIFVDLHAEATSEKYAMGFYLDGRISALVGTHTHVATADARILENGTAFMCDVGMTGSLDSVIGVRKDLIITSFLTQMAVKHEPETDGKMIFNGCLIEIENKNKAKKITHIQKIL